MDNSSDIFNIPSHPHHHLLLLNSLTKYQRGLIKGHIINMDNRFNEIFPSFDPLNPEFCPGNRIIDNFSNHFSFHLFAKSSNRSFLFSFCFLFIFFLSFFFLYVVFVFMYVVMT